MDWTEVGVVIGGAAAIIFVLWYFFGERAAARDADARAREIKGRGARGPE